MTQKLPLALLLSLLPLACEGCRDDKPYTPFGVTSALPAPPPPATASASAPLPSAQPAEVSVKKAVFAPKDARAFSIAGRELESPKGRVFEQLLDADIDGDGKTEIAAWTLAAPDAEGQAPGELWLYSEESSKKVLDFPPFLPTGADCRHTTALSLPGPRSLAVDIQATCDTPRLARSTTRALAIVDPRSTGAARFGVRVADPAPGELLTVGLSVRDEDADGRDDFRLAIGLALPGGDGSVSANLVWLDRAAGVSREAREPGRSLDALLQRELARAKQKKTAKAALGKVELTRRLLGSLCAEGRVPRVFDWDGGPLRCAPLGAVVDRLGATAITAALTLSDTPLALSELLRDGWYFGNMSAKQRSSLQKDIEKKLVRVPVAKIALGARPRAVRSPSYSPLAFDPDGALLVQTDSGLFRLPPDGAREEPLDAEAAVAWPLEVTTASGARLLGVSYSCDRSETALLVVGGPNTMENTSLLAPRPGVCAGLPFDEGSPPAPVSSHDGVRLVIGGLEVGATPGPPPKGSARSPNGKHLAVPTPLGLVIEGAELELWQIDGWDGASSCVVANDARRAACVRRGQAELYLKSAPSSSPF